MVGHNFEIEYHLSLVTTDQYDYYNRVTNNSICYQNQNLNLFENRLERFGLPIAITASTSLELALPTNVELSSYRYYLKGQIECTMLTTSEQTEQENIEHVIAAPGILLSMVGVPAIYYNSLIGSTNYYQGVEESGINRRINRQKFDIEQINDEIANSNQRTAVIAKINHLLEVRGQQPLFNPYNHQQVIEAGANLFALKRFDQDGNEIYCIVNITYQQQSIDLTGTDIITNSQFTGTLSPYQVVWVQQ